LSRDHGDSRQVQVLLLVGVAVLAGASVQRFVQAPRESRPQVLPRKRWQSSPVVVLSLMVVFAVLLWPGPTAEERDTATFGVPVDRHVTRVSARFLDHSPTLTDADVPGGAAVPIERYTLDGQVLTLVVLHNATCRLAVVLLASAKTSWTSWWCTARPRRPPPRHRRVARRMSAASTRRTSSPRAARSTLPSPWARRRRASATSERADMRSGANDEKHRR
jgi:hypothetical protein